MFFYIFHYINHYVIPSNISNGQKNTRTFILGAMAYVLFHGFLYSSRMIRYNYKNYFWWIFAIDFVTMAIVYKNYYSNSIFNEFKNIFGVMANSKVKDSIIKEEASASQEREEVSKEVLEEKGEIVEEVSKEVLEEKKEIVEEVLKEEKESNFKAITINSEDTKSKTISDLKNI
jgi:TRAP-type mannitol/chloroaromatic compound transport system substrate-binding protein